MHDKSTARNTVKGRPTYTLARLIDAGFARMSGNIAKLVLHSLMGGNRHRLGDQKLRGRLLARLAADGDGRGGRVSRLFLGSPHGFRSWGQRQAGRGSHAVVVDEVVEVHGVRLQRGMIRGLAQLRNAARRVDGCDWGTVGSSWARSVSILSFSPLPLQLVPQAAQAASKSAESTEKPAKARPTSLR